MKIAYVSENIYTGFELRSGYFLVEDGIITEVGTKKELAKDVAEIKDFGSSLISPGLIDAHTHLIHAGKRSKELELRLAGKSYLEIHQAGGGIYSSVRATSEASVLELKEKAKLDLEKMLSFGVTTIEAKSGYGLLKEAELRSLEALALVQKEVKQDLVSTFMAHALPKTPEYERLLPKEANFKYLNYLLQEVLPEVRARNLAVFADIFSEKGIFDLAESEYFLKEAKKQGFLLKAHVDEIQNNEAAFLAADLGAVSAEHLMMVSERGIKKMKEAGTVAVLLPATSYFLQSCQYAPAQKFQEAGVKIAIASDYNPGSCPCLNLQFAMSLACFVLKMKPLDVLAAVTINAAKAIGREGDFGSLDLGKKADFVVWDLESPADIFYHVGDNRVKLVYKAGELIYPKGGI